MQFATLDRHAPARRDPTLLRAAVARAGDAVREGLLPGIVVGVGDAGGPLVVETFRGRRTRRLRDDSVFFLASLTKPVVAAAVMRLVDAGRVDLDAPIGRYVPAFGGAGKDRVTVRHVLTHTAGVYDVPTEILRTKRPSAARMLEIVCREPLTFVPGRRYEYCSSSFYLLADILARAEERPFPEALHRLVLEPAGMADTTFDPRHDRSRIVPVEGVPLRNIVVRELVLRYLARATNPGGGLWGTCIDLLRFGAALTPTAIRDGHGLLSQAAVDEMTREQTSGILEVSADGATRDPRYALGWGKPRLDGGIPSVVGGSAPPLGDDVSTGHPPIDGLAAAPGDAVPASPRSFTHGGATGTRLWVDPERDLVFVFLTNQWGAGDGPMFEVLKGVYDAWDGQPPG